MRRVLIVLVAIIVGCNNKQNNASSVDTTLATTDSTSIPAAPATTDFTKDSIFTIRFPKDKSAVTVSGKINGINKPITVNVPVSRGNMLSVLLVPDDPTANIRINQLFLPDGKADGPFGRGINRKITQQGNYKLVIGENLMQGDEWKGIFRLTVKVE